MRSVELLYDRYNSVERERLHVFSSPTKNHFNCLAKLEACADEWTSLLRRLICNQCIESGDWRWSITTQMVLKCAYVIRVLLFVAGRSKPFCPRSIIIVAHKKQRPRSKPAIIEHNAMFRRLWSSSISVGTIGMTAQPFDDASEWQFKRTPNDMVACYWLGQCNQPGMVKRTPCDYQLIRVILQHSWATATLYTVAILIYRKQ